VSAHREIAPWLPWVQVGLLSAWLGAVLIFSAVVAPAAFAVLPSRAIAGVLIGRVLPVLFLAGMTLGAILLAAELAWRRGLWGAASAFGVMLVAGGIAHFVLGARIAALRADIGGPLDALAPGDPRRAAFGRLHGFSVAWLGVALLAALVAIAVIALRERSHSRTVPHAGAPDLRSSVPSSR
jgi:hypothetical protein